MSQAANLQVGDHVEVKQRDEAAHRRFKTYYGQVEVLHPKFITVTTTNGYRVTVNRHDITAKQAEINLKEAGEMLKKGSGELGRAEALISRDELIRQLQEGKTAGAIGQPYGFKAATIHNLKAKYAINLAELAKEQPQPAPQPIEDPTPTPAPTLALSGFLRFDGAKVDTSAITIGKKGIYITGDMTKSIEPNAKMTILLAKDGASLLLIPSTNGLPCRNDKSSGKMISTIKVVRAAEGMGLTLPARFNAEWDGGIGAWVGRR